MDGRRLAVSHVSAGEARERHLLDANELAERRHLSFAISALAAVNNDEAAARQRIRSDEAAALQERYNCE